MKAHFDGSLKYLFKSFQFSGQAMQRPGMAALLRGKSDEHWQEGLVFMRKFFQRGGEVNATRFQNHFSFEGSFAELPLSINPESTSTVEMSDFYAHEMLELTRDTEVFAEGIKAIRAHVKAHRDPDMAHFVQEKHEHEVKNVRKYTIAQRNLQLMYSPSNRNGLALHMFDQSLL